MVLLYVDAYNSPFRVEKNEYFSIPKGFSDFDVIKSTTDFKSFYIGSVPTIEGPISLMLFSEKQPTLECP
jgi:hypothetical protein